MAIGVLEILELLIPLFVILIGCELFTNGIEWAGVKLGLAESATGSVLAAVGTALPETVVPIVAIVFSAQGSGEAIAEGAILGVAVYIAYKKGRRPAILKVSKEHLSLDIWSFLIAYSLAVIAALFLQGSSTETHILRYSLAVILIILYVIYVRKMIKDESKKCDVPDCLHLMRPFPNLKIKEPSTAFVLIQVFASLAIIIIGAKIFVGGIEVISEELGISNIILAFLIAPIATELPEKFNSVLWYWRGKDTLALGNVTGAMVFQSSIPVSIGIVFTDWVLDPITIASMGFAMIAIFMIYAEMRMFKQLSYKTLVLSGAFYVLYLGIVIWMSVAG
jgi:cation:H+ antiporter